MVSLKIDKDQLANAKLMLEFLGRSVDPIVIRSINKTIDNSQTKAVDLIYEIVNLTKTRIREDFRKFKAYTGKLMGTLLAEGKPVGFMSFKPSELKKGGISIKFQRSGERFIFRHNFIASAKGAENVWEREEYYGRPWIRNYPYWKLPDKYRLPLDRQQHIAIEDYYKDDRIYVPTLEYAGDRLEANTLDQIDYELSKL